MRRDYLWYGIAFCWALAAAIGLLRHHGPQALPALLFAVFFAITGVWTGRRDKPARERRLALKK